MIGKRFGRLVVLSDAPRDKAGRRRVFAKCVCGKSKQFDAYSVKSGNASSCGCLNSELTSARRKTHGHSHRFGTNKHTRTYAAWLRMRQRCSDPNADNYQYYGGRGITVSPLWIDDFSQFLRDMGECPSGLTLERKEVNGNYTPDNCVWATWKQQAQNRRNTKK